jgi:hypothetical protein
MRVLLVGLVVKDRRIAYLQRMVRGRSHADLAESSRFRHGSEEQLDSSGFLACGAAAPFPSRSFDCLRSLLAVYLKPAKRERISIAGGVPA